MNVIIQDFRVQTSLREQVKPSIFFWGNMVTFSEMNRKHSVVFQSRMNLWPMTRQAQLSLLDGRHLEHCTASNLLAQQSKTCKNAETFATWLTKNNKKRGFIGCFPGKTNNMKSSQETQMVTHIFSVKLIITMLVFYFFCMTTGNTDMFF